MKKLLITCVILILTLCGCSEPPYSSAVGDFTFYPPEGYSIEAVTDLNCVLVRDADSTVVGGIELTAMKRKVLTEDHAKAILLYLQEEFHQTCNVEYITSRWGSQNPLVSVHLRKYEQDDTQTMYTHIFYRKDSWVYHLWLNEEIAGEEAAGEFMDVLK